jgi:hypothetical protein
MAYVRRIKDVSLGIQAVFGKNSSSLALLGQNPVKKRIRTDVRTLEQGWTNVRNLIEDREGNQL